MISIEVCLGCCIYIFVLYRVRKKLIDTGLRQLILQVGSLVVSGGARAQLPFLPRSRLHMILLRFLRHYSQGGNDRKTKDSLPSLQKYVLNKE